jgi:hypothetical protein
MSHAVSLLPDHPQDPRGKVAFYWGTAADGAIAFSDDAKLLKEGCGKSFAPFPQGNAISLTVSVMGGQILCQEIDFLELQCAAFLPAFGCLICFSVVYSGCFFSADGLHSFEHPMSPLKPVPRVDSQGQMCGSLFKV